MTLGFRSTVGRCCPPFGCAGVFPPPNFPDADVTAWTWLAVCAVWMKTLGPDNPLLCMCSHLSHVSQRRCEKFDHIIIRLIVTRKHRDLNLLYENELVVWKWMGEYKIMQTYHTRFIIFIWGLMQCGWAHSAKKIILWVCLSECWFGVQRVIKSIHLNVGEKSPHIKSVSSNLTNVLSFAAPHHCTILFSANICRSLFMPMLSSPPSSHSKLCSPPSALSIHAWISVR